MSRSWTSRSGVAEPDIMVVVSKSSEFKKAGDGVQQQRLNDVASQDTAYKGERRGRASTDEDDTQAGLAWVCQSRPLPGRANVPVPAESATSALITSLSGMGVCY